jgi:hypothetical protein
VAAVSEPDFITGMMLLIGYGAIVVAYFGFALLVWKMFTGEEL